MVSQILPMVMAGQYFLHSRLLYEGVPRNDAASFFVINNFLTSYTNLCILFPCHFFSIFVGGMFVNSIILNNKLSKTSTSQF